MRYYPFLKSKRGELRALKTLQKHTEFIPVIDFLSAKGITNPATLDEMIKKFHENILEYLSPQKLFYLDHFDVPLEARTSSGAHYVSTHEGLIVRGFEIGLVTGLDRDIDYNKATKDLAEKYDLSIAIRLLKDDLSIPRIMLNDLKALLQYFKNISQVKIIIDLKVVSKESLSNDIERVINTLKLLASIENIQEIIIASSSFPDTIGDIVSTGHNCNYPRFEHLLWNQVNESVDTPQLTFGDYTVVSPDFTELVLEKGAVPTIAPKATYTLSDFYYITRGKSTKAHPLGYKQFIILAREVTALKDYRNGSSSEGEKYISMISNENEHSRRSKSGSPETWITATVIQHVDYISSL